MLTGGPVLRDLLEEVAVRVEEERHARNEHVHVQTPPPRPTARTRGRRASVNASSWSAVAPASRMWYPLTEMVFQRGTSLRAEREDVGDEPHRRTRRKDVFLLGDEFLEDVVLNRARERLPVRALPLGHDEIHREDHRGRRVDRHRRGDVAEGDAVEQRLHVGQRGDVDAALPDLAERERVIGIAAHQRREIEGDAQPGAAGRQQRLVARVGLLRRAEPGKLPHRPQLAAVAGGMNAARVGEDAGRRETSRRSRPRRCRGARSALPEIVVNAAARSGACFSAGSSVSRSHRCFSVSAAVFIRHHYIETRLASVAACRTDFSRTADQLTDPDTLKAILR